MMCCSKLCLVALACIFQSAVSSEEAYLVRLEISHVSPAPAEDSLTLRVEPSWSPLGAAHFKKLVSASFYDGACFFRVIPRFVAQVGIPADPSTSLPWKTPIQDDPISPASNKRGFVSFATSGKNSRTYQIFFNLEDNSRLDKMGFTPFAVVEGNGMESIDRVFKTGNDGPGSPNQGEIQAHGNEYLKKNFPKLSCIKRALLLTPVDVKPVVAEEIGLRSGQSDDSPLSVGFSGILFVFAVFATLLLCVRFNSNKTRGRDLDA